MLEIPADSGKGKGANERKASLVAALLGRAPPLEAQYIVRSIRGKLRSGLGDRSLRAALAQAAAHGHTVLAAWLLERGVALDAVDSDGRTAFW